ncbi:hypothetical protein DmGdi_31590 [Gluconobacter sp. Gdi]|nr:hypothetical protein DmGdi_31590 [Gluconobacter sp. Gdi]
MTVLSRGALLPEGAAFSDLRSTVVLIAAAVAFLAGAVFCGSLLVSLFS